MVKQKVSKGKKAAPIRPANKNRDVRKSARAKTRTGSKQVEVIGMLSRPQGITIPAIMKATGWQQHSVRGFFAGVVRKKLELALQSEKKEGADRVYRIATDTAKMASDKAVKRLKPPKTTKSSRQSSNDRAH